MNALSLSPSTPPPLTPAQAALVQANVSLVPYAVRRFAADLPEHPLVQCAAMEEGDLVSLGYLALMRAARTWEEGRGMRFSTWAVHLIRQALRGYVQRLAARPPSHVRLMPLSLDEPRERSDGSTQGTLVEVVVDPNADTRRAALALIEQAELRQALARLPARQAQVLAQHYGMTGWGESCLGGQTFTEIAAGSGVSRQRVQQVHDAALKRLRRELQEMQELQHRGHG